jgi:hypothetical protein
MEDDYMKEIIEPAGIQICDICGKTKECNYHFYPPDRGECYICHDCEDKYDED